MIFPVGPVVDLVERGDMMIVLHLPSCDIKARTNIWCCEMGPELAFDMVASLPSEALSLHLSHHNNACLVALAAVCSCMCVALPVCIPSFEYASGKPMGQIGLHRVALILRRGYVTN